MPYRQNGRDRWIVKASYRGRQVRLSTGTPVQATAERYEAVLRELVRHDHAEVIEALLAREVGLGQVARWWAEAGDTGLLGALRRWREERTDGRPLRPTVDEWLAERCAFRDTAPVTLDRYAVCLRRVIGDRLVARDLTREAVIGWLATVPNARKTHVALSLWGRWAVGKGYLRASPMDQVPVPAAGKPRDRWLGQERLGDLLAAVRPRYRDAVTLAYGTGIEREVLVHLSPRDVDVPRKAILARGTKTSVRERRVRVAEFAWPVVLRLLAERGSKRTLLPPMTGWALSKAHREAADAIGEPGLRLHDARHAFAVRLAKAGAPPQVIADQLGNSVEMVLKVYGKYSPSDAEKDHWEARATAAGW